MATYTWTLVLEAATAAEYAAMKVYVLANTLPGYVITWKDSHRRCTVTSLGIRPPDWSL